MCEDTLTIILEYVILYTMSTYPQAKDDFNGLCILSCVLHVNESSVYHYIFQYRLHAIYKQSKQQAFANVFHQFLTRDQ